MFQLQVLHLLKYNIYIFDDGYKGDPQKALLNAASMRATSSQQAGRYSWVIQLHVCVVGLLVTNICHVLK